MNSQLHSQLNEDYRVDYQVNLHPPQDVSPRLSPAIEEYIRNTLETASSILGVVHPL